MAATTPKKVMLQTAAADSYSKPGAAMTRAALAIAESKEPKAEPADKGPDKGTVDGTGRKTR